MYGEILQTSDHEQDEWHKAMVKELKSLGDLGSFKLVHRLKGANILQSTWAFKRKRYPDGRLRK